MDKTKFQMIDDYPHGDCKHCTAPDTKCSCWLGTECLMDKMLKNVGSDISFNMRKERSDG